MDVKLQILLNILDEVTKRYDEIFELKEKLLEEANYKSTHDLLTNLYNRNYFEKKVKELMNKNIPFSIVFIDLDNFKYVNDTFGHDKGDEILISTAEILRKNLKGKDLIARFGGDEFVAAVIECDKNCAKAMFEKIQEEINYFFKEFNVTASIGIASFPEIKEYDKLIKEADKKMYKSKRDGKNRINL